MNGRKGWTLGHMSTPRGRTTLTWGSNCVCDLHVYNHDQDTVSSQGVDMSYLSTPRAPTPRTSPANATPYDNADPTCISCGADRSGCELKRWLSGRSCCTACAHPPPRPETRPGGDMSLPQKVGTTPPTEVVPGLVEVEVAVPRLTPALR